MFGHVEGEKAEKTPESEEEKREAAKKGEHAAEKASFTVSEELQAFSSSALAFFHGNSPRELSGLWRQTFIVTCLFRSRSISGHVLPGPIIVLASTDLDTILVIVLVPLIVACVLFLRINDEELRLVQRDKGEAQVQDSQPDTMGPRFILFTLDLSHPFHT